MYTETPVGTLTKYETSVISTSFLKEQPDLNFHNLDVQEEIKVSTDTHAVFSIAWALKWLFDTLDVEQ